MGEPTPSSPTPAPAPRPASPSEKANGLWKLARRFGWLAAILVVLLVGTAAYFASRTDGGTNVPVVYTVEPGDVTIQITERGELRALDSVTISARKDYPIIFMAPEGSDVKEGDLLLELDSSKYQAELEEAEASYQVAEANLQKAQKEFESQELKLEAGIARFEAEVRLAELEMEELRNKPLPHELEQASNQLENAKLVYRNADNKRKFMPDLVEKGFVTRAALEKAELEFLEAKSRLSSAQYNFDTVSAGATPKELQRAEIRLDQARIGLQKARDGMLSELQSFEASVARERANLSRSGKLVKKAEVRLARTTNYAPRDGIVVYALAGEGSTEKVQLGMIPYQGQPVMYLPDLSQMVVDAQINEIDVGKVTVGSAVEVKLEAYPNVVFPGEVTDVSSLAKIKSGAAGAASGIKAFDVTVLVKDNDERLKPGLTVVLDIVVDEQKDVLSVPLRAVSTRNGEHVVFVTAGGKIEERKVVLGLSNEHIVIVEEGLEPGEQVLLGRPPS